MTEWKCENPDCWSSKAHTHEIFFGRGIREKSIELGYQIDLCVYCHQRSHGIYKSGEIRSTKEHWQRKWCEAKNIDFEEALLKTNRSR